MKKFILLLEDDQILTESICKVLSGSNYHVMAVTSVKEGLAKLRNQKFFCVITDIRVGEESGEDFIDAIRSKPEKDPNRAVPILVISGFLDRALAERLQSNINGALVKPFSLESLLSKLQALEQR